MTPVKTGSDRSFGFLFAAVFVIIALWPLLGGNAIRWWSVGISVVFLLVAIAHPALLAPLNRAWMRFGLLLNSIMTPVIMGVLFLVAVTPIALLMRLVGKRPLHLDFDKSASSYWIRRSPPGPPPASMKNQF